jgi:RNA polymerase sigma-70 factor, ECF subfamily
MAATTGETAFLERLIAETRPSLHRYCARMMGSAFEGEDVVQEALEKAAQSIAAGGAIKRPKSWLFQIAHNAALDALRRRRRRAEVQFDAQESDLPDAATADAKVAATASLASFLALPATQRSCVVLIDVLGYQAAETADVLGLTLQAVKAGLRRGRRRLSEIAALSETKPPSLSIEERRRLREYADRFNARDFDALRDLLAEDVRLDLVNRRRLAGRKDVSVYFTRYDSVFDWTFSVGLAENRPALLVRDPRDRSGVVTHVVLLDWAEGKIAAIRDFKYAPYVLESLQISEP